MRQTILGPNGKPLESGKKPNSLHAGADELSAELATWKAHLVDPDEEYLPERDTLVARTKAVRRDYPLLAGAIRSGRDQTVGTNFRPEPRIDWRALGWDKKTGREVAATMRRVWRTYAEDPDCWIDAEGANTFTQLCGLAYSSWAVTGDTLATVNGDRDSSRPFRTAIQLLSSDRLITPMDLTGDRNRSIRGGFEVNRSGRRIAAFIERSLRERLHLSAGARGWTRYPMRRPWGRPRVIHVFDKEYPSQIRGKSTWTTALKKVRMLEKFEDTVLQAAVFQATYAAWIKSMYPSSVLDQMGPDLQRTVVQGQTEYYNIEGRPALNNVKIPFLNPGDEVEISRPTQPIETFGDFEDAMFRHLAAAGDSDLASFTRDFTKTNYSGARQAIMQQFQQRLARREFIVGPFATQVYLALMEELIVTGKCLIPGTENFTEEQRFSFFWDNRRALTSVEWNGPGLMHIDPMKGARSAEIEKGMGVLTNRRYCSLYLGIDYDDVVEDLEWEASIRGENKPAESASVSDQIEDLRSDLIDE